MAWSDAVRALRHRNFKLFFVGQMLSMIGTWMQRLAVGWLAYELTGSPVLLGYVGFAGSAPAIVLSPLAGVLIDRFNTHRLLILAQTLGLFHSALLGLLTVTGAMTPGRLLLFSLVLAVITSFENPVRQTFYVDMVPREDLPNAIALNSSLVSVARIAGPAIGGIVVAAYGAGVCFLLNSLSFVAVVIALLAMRIDSGARSASKDSGLQALREGLSFVRNDPTARSVLTVFAIVSFAGTPYLTLLPIVAVDVLHSGAHGFGWLMAGSGVGAIVASIAMAVRTNPSEVPRLVRAGGFVYAFALVVLGLSRWFALSWLMLFLIGIAFIFVVAGTQTVLHTIVLDALRGRVMSFYSLGFVGIPPFGSLFSGWLADAVGTPVTLIAGGLVCLAAALLYPGARLDAEARA